MKWIKKTDPDIVAFQELNGFTHASLDSFARQFGHACPTELYKQKQSFWGGTSRIDYIWLNASDKKQLVHYNIIKDKVIHQIIIRF